MLAIFHHTNYRASLHIDRSHWLLILQIPLAIIMLLALFLIH